MLDFNSILGEDYDDNMSLKDFIGTIKEKDIDLVAWDNNKHTKMSDYITLEEKFKEEKKARKSLESELATLKNGDNEALNESQKTIKGLEDKVNQLVRDKEISESKAVYATMGYSAEIIAKLVEADFYEGEDKIAHRAAVMKEANDSLLANYKKDILSNDKAPSVGNETTISKAQQYKSQYQQALDNGRLDQAAAIMREASVEGIDIHK